MSLGPGPPSNTPSTHTNSPTRVDLSRHFKHLPKSQVANIILETRISPVKRLISSIPLSLDLEGVTLDLQRRKHPSHISDTKAPTQVPRTILTTAVPTQRIITIIKGDSSLNRREI